MDKALCDNRTEMLRAAAQGLAKWFAVNGRELPWRVFRTPYKVLVSETMLQQTRIEAVMKYWDRFMEAFPTLTALAEAPDGQVMKCWEGLGYYSRARNLKKAAEICAEKYGGRLPESFEELKKLPGLGNYSAGAVASLCWEEPVPAVDGNVLRVLARFFGDARDVRLPEVRKEAEEIIRAVLEAEEAAVSLFNEGLMELGETLCGPKGKPQCEACPLKDACRAHAGGREETLPYRSANRARSIEEKTVWVFVCGGRTGLEKRPDKGMLRGLYGFPMTEGQVTEDAAAVLAEQGIEALNVLPLGAAKHIFTHREWHMTGYLAETKEPVPGLTYVTAEELLEAYALPSAFRYYRDAVIRELEIPAMTATLSS